MTDYTDKILENSQIAAQNAAFYDEFWQLEQIGISNFHYVRAKFITEAIRAYKSAEKNLRILDFGCGTGWLSLFISEFGEYMGIDYSRKAIKYASCIYEEHGKFQVAEPSAIWLGLEQKPFDIIIASEVIEHVNNHPAFLAQIDTMLKKGGLLILTTPNGELYDIFYRKYKDEMQPIENWLTPLELKELLNKHKFNLIKQEGVLYRHPVYGLRAYLISDRLAWLFSRFKKSSLYQQLLLRVSVYQFVASIK